MNFSETLDCIDTDSSSSFQLQCLSLAKNRSRCRGTMITRSMDTTLIGKFRIVFSEALPLRLAFRNLPEEDTLFCPKCRRPFLASKNEADSRESVSQSQQLVNELSRRTRYPQNSIVLSSALQGSPTCSAARNSAKNIAPIT